MRYAPVRAILSSNAPSVASVSRFWRSYSTSPTRPTASNVTATKSPATRTLRRCQSLRRGNWFADVDVTAAIIAGARAGSGRIPSAVALDILVPSAEAAGWLVLRVWEHDDVETA